MANESVVIGFRDALTLSRGMSGASGDLWSLHVRLVADDLVAEANVEPEGVDCSLDDFFAGMAHSWRGWPGARRWASRDQALTLTCSHDGLGHVRIATVLRRVARGSWEVCGDAVVDAGQLDELARKLRVFLGSQAD